MTFLSVGMFMISLWSRKSIMIVPGILDALWPCAMLTSSIAMSFVHFSFVNGLFANFS